MSQHSSAYLKMKQDIVQIRSNPIQFQVPAGTQFDINTALEIFREHLHAMVNAEYLHDHGITETEHEQLHSLIEGAAFND